jgi:hypothetical protein
MLLKPAPGGQIAFFEVAATLIPILVFSGVVAERNGPQPQDSYRRTKAYAVAIPLLGTLAILAEVISINAIILGGTGKFDVGFVASSLLLGLLGVVLMVWAPWLRALRKRMPQRYGIVWAGAAALFVFLFMIAVKGTVQAVTAADSVRHTSERLRVYERRVHAVEADLERTARTRERVQVQQRADARAIAQTVERLVRARAEHAPAPVLKALELRFDQETRLTRVDRESFQRLSKKIERLFEKLDKTIATVPP